MPKNPRWKRIALIAAAVAVGYLLLNTLYDSQMAPDADTGPKAIVSNELDGSHNSALPPPDPAHLSVAERKQVRAAFAGLSEQGLVREVEVEARRALLAGALWDALTPEAQEEAARTIALYATEQTGRDVEPWDFYDAASGERLFRYDPSGLRTD